MGPGIGIQIPATGKLLAMGKGYALNDRFSGHDVSATTTCFLHGAQSVTLYSWLRRGCGNHLQVVIASEDNGQHWRTAYIFNGTDGLGLDEPQLALLPNGHVMANMRYGVRNCPGHYAGATCRAIATSTDQGERLGERDREFRGLT